MSAIKALASALGQLVAIILFKVVQVTVAGFFTLLVFAQTFLSGISRLFGEPAAKLKVDRARAEQTASSGGQQLLAARTELLSTQQHDGRPNNSSIRQRVRPSQQQEPNDRAASDDGHSAAGPNPGKPIHVFPEPELGHDSLAWQLVGPYMRAYGRHAIANSQLFNPEFIHFFVPGVGSLPYVILELYNRVAVFGIGEPLAHRSAWRQLTEMFLQEFPEAYFHHLTEEYADLLHDMGYWINSAGSETTLQVQSWTYNGKTRTVRAAARAAREFGVRVRELKPEELTEEMRHKLQHDVSGDWHQQKSIADRHLRVYVRNVDYSTMQLRDGVRIFVAEAYDPALAPPAEVDPVLQGAAANAKPPKPPRVKRSKSSSSASGLLRPHSSSQLSTVSSCGSLSSMVSLTVPPTFKSWLSSKPTAAAAAAAAGGDGCVSAGDAAPAPGAAAAADGDKGDQGGSGQVKDDAGGKCVHLKARCAVKDSVASTAPTAAADSAVDVGAGNRDQTNGSSLDMTEAAAAGAGDSAAAAAAAAAAPQLVGFVLLDPLWEGGEEVGYVTSMMRMTRAAHSGTLKLLLEDTISTLRKEGKRELTFGFAPLFNLRDSQQQRRYIHWLNWVQNYIFFCANNVYAFKNLAFSKVRYGAGLDEKGKQYRDPNVVLTNVYQASKHYMPGFNILDLYAFLTYIGLVDTPISTFLKLVGLTKGGANLPK